LGLLDHDPGALAILKKRHDAHQALVPSEVVEHP